MRRGWRARAHAARHRLGHSLKWRLVGLFLLLAIATTVTFVAGTRELLHHGWQGWGRPITADYIDTLTREIGTPPDAARAQALTERLPISVRIEGPQVNWDSHPEQTRRWQEWKGQFHESEMHDWHRRQLADGHRISFGLAKPQGMQAPHYIGWTTLGVLLTLTLIAYGYVRHLLRPLDDIHEGALKFARGDFGHRIPLLHHDELGELTRQINLMAGEIHGMLDAKRALLLAISHELRSPLTRARVNAELIEESEARQALLLDLAEMRDLVMDLLESERLAMGHAALHREATDLNALVGEVLAGRREGPPADTALAADLPLLALDRTRMRLLLRNLLDNAIRHTPEGAAAPVVSTSADTDTVRLSVRDHGPGVPDEHLSQLSQPFHRADAARQRSTGGFGLGLYLCRLVAQAHGGRLDIRNATPGLEVSVILPA